MKYHEGNIVLLKNGKTVYIVSVDEDEQKYLVVDAESAEPNAKAQYVKEANIQMLLSNHRPVLFYPPNLRRLLLLSSV